MPRISSGFPPRICDRKPELEFNFVSKTNLPFDLLTDWGPDSWFSKCSDENDWTKDLDEDAENIESKVCPAQGEFYRGVAKVKVN